MWLDPENSSNAAAADRVPTETFAFMPDWLGGGYYLRGRKGYWDPRITGNIAQQVCNLQAILCNNIHAQHVPCLDLMGIVHCMQIVCMLRLRLLHKLTTQALMMSYIKHHLALLHVALSACSAVVHVSLVLSFEGPAPILSPNSFTCQQKIPKLADQSHNRM